MCMLELLMLKRHILFVPDGDFTASDIDEVIRSMIIIIIIIIINMEEDINGDIV